MAKINGFEVSISKALVATRCACCGRRLSDADSVQLGMGKVCRRDHGFEAPDGTTDLAEALVRIDAAMTPEMAGEAPWEPSEKAQKAMLEGNARLICNAIVYAIACDPCNFTRNEHLVAAVQYLGYVTLAARFMANLANFIQRRAELAAEAARREAEEKARAEREAKRIDMSLDYKTRLDANRRAAMNAVAVRTAGATVVPFARMVIVVRERGTSLGISIAEGTVATKAQFAAFRRAVAQFQIRFDWGTKETVFSASQRANLWAALRREAPLDGVMVRGTDGRENRLVYSASAVAVAQ